MRAPSDTEAIGTPGAADSKQYIAFELGEQFYGVEITTVREIRQWSATADLPDQPHYGRGVLDIRGEVVPVYDLRARLGGAIVDVTDSHVVLILWIDGRNVGVLVDSVFDIISINAGDLRPVPDGICTIEASTVTNLAALGDRMVALIDCSMLFGAKTIASVPAGEPGNNLPTADEAIEPAA